MAVPVLDMPPTEVGIAWSAERESDLVLDFVAVVCACGGAGAPAAAPTSVPPGADHDDAALASPRSDPAPAAPRVGATSRGR